MPWETWRKAAKRQRKNVSAGWTTSGRVSLRQKRQGGRQMERERERGREGVLLLAARHQSPGPTYGASYPHCSLWRPSRAACGCCPRPPSCRGPGRRRSWPRSSGGPEPGRCHTEGEGAGEGESDAMWRKRGTRKRRRRGRLLLSGLQRDNYQDGPPVHAAHAAGVAHEVVEYRGELGAHLRAEEGGGGGRRRGGGGRRRGEISRRRAAATRSDFDTRCHKIRLLRCF